MPAGEPISRGNAFAPPRLPDASGAPLRFSFLAPSLPDRPPVVRLVAAVLDESIPAPRRTVAVSHPTALAEALAAARPGDLVLVEDGDYPGDFVLAQTASAEAPIVVAARHLLQARFSGTFTLKGSHGILYGLWFHGPDSGIRIAGSDNRVTRCRASDSTLQAVISFAKGGARGRLDHCDITVRPFDGSEPRGTVRRAVVIETKADGSHPHARIDHNWIHDFSAKPDPSDYDSGFNTALVATTTGFYADIPTFAVIEYNLFENMNQGKGAAVGTKGSRTFFRYNTFLSGDSFLELRNGRQSEVIANWFENWKYVSVRDSDHLIAGNVFVNSDGLYLMAGNREADLLDNRSGRAVRVRVARNVGPVVVGKAWARHTWPAKDNVIEAHEGKITLELQEGTIVRETSDLPAYAPVRLRREDVGPFAP